MSVKTKDEMYLAFGQCIPCVFQRGEIVKVGNQDIQGGPPQMAPIKMFAVEMTDDSCERFLVKGYDPQMNVVHVFADFS